MKIAPVDIKTANSPLRPVNRDSQNYANLRESIRQNGMHTPITVTNQNELVHGAQRLAIALELGLSKVPVKSHLA